MEHLALYRKYRPKTFEDVIGQEHITHALQNQIASDKINRMIFCFNLFDISSPLFTYIICIIFNKYEKIYIGDKNVNCFF